MRRFYLYLRQFVITAAAFSALVAARLRRFYCDRRCNVISDVERSLHANLEYGQALRRFRDERAKLRR